MASRIVQEINVKVEFPDRLDAAESALRGMARSDWGIRVEELSPIELGFTGMRGDLFMTRDDWKMDRHIMVVRPSDLRGPVAYVVVKAVAENRYRFEDFDLTEGDPKALFVKRLSQWGGGIQEVLQRMSDQIKAHRKKHTAHVDIHGHSHFDTPRGQASLDEANGRITGGDGAAEVKHRGLWKPGWQSAEKTVAPKTFMSCSPAFEVEQKDVDTYFVARLAGTMAKIFGIPVDDVLAAYERQKPGSGQVPEEPPKTFVSEHPTRAALEKDVAALKAENDALRAEVAWLKEDLDFRKP